MTTPDTDATLEKVRKLLNKAEAEGVTEEEAKALTAKAAELMAKYGIDRALLAATRPETDKPSDKVIDIPNPWARVQSHLLAGLASAMRCQCVLLPTRDAGSRIHLFGYTSDLERVDVMYTSLLLQMFSGLRQAHRPEYVRSLRAWNRSWLLGFCTAVVARVREAENKAAGETASSTAGRSSSVAVVLADRSVVIQQNLKAAYPVTRTSRVTYSGNGYSGGHAAGNRANISGSSVGGRSREALH